MSEKISKVEDPIAMLYISKAVRLLIFISVLTYTGVQVNHELSGKPPIEILQALLKQQE